MSTHHAVEQGRRFVADLWGVHVDAAHGRCGEVAKEFIIVHTEHSDLVRHGDISAQAAVQHLLTAIIMAGHQRTGPRQSAQPAGEMHAFLLGAEGWLRMLINLTLKAMCQEFVTKAVAAFVLIAVLTAWRATEGKASKATGQEMLHSEMHHVLIVDADYGQPNLGQRGAQVDGRNAQSDHGAGGGFVIDAGDNSVAFPCAQPRGWGLAKAMCLEGDGPRPVFALIADDATQQATSVFTGGLNEKGDSESFHAGG